MIIPHLHKLSPSDGQQLMLWRERLSHEGERQLLLGPLAPVVLLGIANKIDSAQ